MHVSIRIKGHLDQGWQEGLQIVHEPDGTSRLSGPPWCAHEDQSFELDAALARKQRTNAQRGLIPSFSEEQGQRTVAFQVNRQFLLAPSNRNLEHVREENIMRKVYLGMNITLDGYVAGPNRELDWAFRAMSPDMGEWVTELLRGVDTILLGHTTYLQQAAAWPSQTGEMADLLNSHAKIVFSRRLTTLEWNNSRLATADAAEEIARLKQQPGKNIYVSGGATLAQSLARMGLIDEYNLVMHPVVLGSGKSLFKDLPQSLNLKLVSAKTFDSGAIGLTYQLA